MFKVELHDNSYEYFKNIDISENALHITSNLSIAKLLNEINYEKIDTWKIKSINHFLSESYPKLHDLINNNRLKIELRNILINNQVDENLMQEENINILLSDYIFLIQSGIRTVPNIEGISKEREVVLNIFNDFVKTQVVKELIEEISSSTNLRDIKSKTSEEKITKIYLYNFNNLHLSRMVFLSRLKYLGYEVIFRIPHFGIKSVDEPWLNLYSRKYFEIKPTYKRYSDLKESIYVDYLEGKNIERKDDSDIEFKEFLGSFEFKNEIENNKEKAISYYCLDPKLINQVFDIDDNKEYHMPLIRFMSNMYNVVFEENKILLNYSLMAELLTSGFVEIKEGNRNINGIYYLEFIKNLESYFEGVDNIDSIIDRIEELRNLKLASDTMENEVKQKIGKNKVKRFLSNPLRCISYINIENYDITLLQFKSLVERLRYILKTTIKREDGFVDFNKNNIFLLSIMERNNFIQELKENEEYKDTVSKIYKALEYTHDIDNIYKEDVKELLSILLNKEQEEKVNQILPIDTIDGDWQRDIYTTIHISDLSFKAYQKYLEKKKTIGKYINHKLVDKILQTDLYKDKNVLKDCLQIAKLSVNNIELFFNYDIANLIINYKGKVILSYIENLRDGDSESILLRILKNIYKKDIKSDNELLDYLDDIDIKNIETYKNNDLGDKYIITKDISNKHRDISPIGYRDLDFCGYKFVFSNIIEPNVIYDSDFHHKMVFSTLISLFKKDIPNYDDNIKKFLFPLFPQWNNTTKENMLLTNYYNLNLKEYNLYENINYPKNMDKLQILMSKYIVTEKYKVKNRYKENKLDTEKFFNDFASGYLNDGDMYNKGKHCTMCPHILICKKGEYAVERDS